MQRSRGVCSSPTEQNWLFCIRQSLSLRSSDHWRNVLTISACIPTSQPYKLGTVLARFERLLKTLFFFSRGQKSAF